MRGRRASRGRWTWSLVAGIAALLLPLGCSGGGSGATGTTGGGSTGTNTAPEAVVATPDRAQADDVTISYEVRDAESDPVDVTVEYSADGGRTWHPATEGRGGSGRFGLASSPQGEAHDFVWDSASDVQARNLMEARIRVRPADMDRGRAVVTNGFPLMNLGRRDPDCDYVASHDPVIRVQQEGGLVLWSYQVNRMPYTTIHGDGTVIFTDPQNGHRRIYRGHLTEAEICHLLLEARDAGFWSWTASPYRPNYQCYDCPNQSLEINLRNRSMDVDVISNGPPGYATLFDTLRDPQLRPANVVHYDRQPITSSELNQGWYHGQEHEKKLDTPQGWRWIDRGANSIWSQ